ncbi:hypothetical protein GGF43_000813, partial [Coemansia sp. RSA 2618]
MSIFTRFWRSITRKDCILNIVFIGIFALVIIGIVLGTVLPKHHQKLLQLEGDSLDLTNASSKHEKVEDATEKDLELKKPTDLFAGYFIEYDGEYNDGESSTSVPPRNTVALGASTTGVSSSSSFSEPAMETGLSDFESYSFESSSESPESSENAGSSSLASGDGDNSDYTAGRPLWGLTYSPYNTDGSCADLATVASQLQKVAALTDNIRLYSTDCSQMRNAMQAISSSKLNMGIHAGLWITDGATRMQSDLNEFIAAAKQYDSSLIKGLSVGNEDISKGMSEATLVGYINQVRSRLQNEGLGHIPVYTTEQDALFSKTLASACDLVQINVHTIFDATFTSIDASVQSVIQRVNTVEARTAGKLVRIGETGWASSGNTGVSPLTLANEVSYAQKFKCAADAHKLEYFYFEAKDALWKQGQAKSEQ